MRLTRRGLLNLIAASPLAALLPKVAKAEQVPLDPHLPHLRRYWESLPSDWYSVEGWKKLVITRLQLMEMRKVPDDLGELEQLLGVRPEAAQWTVDPVTSNLEIVWR